MTEVNYIAINCNFVIAGKGNSSYESKLQMEAGRLGISSAVSMAWLLIRSGQSSYKGRSPRATTFLHGESGASHRKQKRRAMFCSICVSEPDYAYILRRCW